MKIYLLQKTGLKGCSKPFRDFDCSLVKSCGSIKEGTVKEDLCDPSNDMVRIENLLSFERYKKRTGDTNFSNFKITQGNYYRNTKGANLQEDLAKYNQHKTDLEAKEKAKEFAKIKAEAQGKEQARINAQQTQTTPKNKWLDWEKTEGKITLAVGLFLGYKIFIK